MFPPGGVTAPVLHSIRVAPLMFPVLGGAAAIIMGWPRRIVSRALLVAVDSLLAIAPAAVISFIIRGRLPTGETTRWRCSHRSCGRGRSRPTTCRCRHHPPVDRMATRSRGTSPVPRKRGRHRHRSSSHVPSRGLRAGTQPVEGAPTDRARSLVGGDREFPDRAPLRLSGAETAHIRAISAPDACGRSGSAFAVDLALMLVETPEQVLLERAPPAPPGVRHRRRTERQGVATVSESGVM